MGEPAELRCKIYDTTIIISKDHSDITFDEYLRMCAQVAHAVGFSAKHVDEFFGDVG